MKEHFLRILRCLTEGFDKGPDDSITVKSWLSIENTSENDLKIMDEAISEFNEKSKTVNVEFKKPEILANKAALPDYLIRIYKIHEVK